MNKRTKIACIFCTAAVLLSVGCARTSTSSSSANTVAASSTAPAASSTASSVQVESEAASADTLEALPHIYLRLGEAQSRPSYEIELLDNEVSVRFVRILQDMTRVIPLYVFDGSENTDVLQFYDIPSSYDVPEGEPELVTSEKAGEVYYSDGRIMIFYQDAEIEGYYVKIGETLTTEGLADAVNSNPLDDWGNRRVTIGIAE